jgi:hypothetical protein
LVRKAQVSDKSLHFVAYLILVFLLWFAISPGRKVNWRRAAVWWVLVVVVGYGVADELIQGYVGRNCDVIDFLADLAGSLAGLILLSIFPFLTASLVITGAAIFILTSFTRANLADLLPVPNAVFHLFGYALFSMLWIRYLHLLPIKAPKPKWLIAALAPPMAFLFVVKLVSVISGKNFEGRELLISVLGIATVVAVVYLLALFHQNCTKKLLPK